MTHDASTPRLRRNLCTTRRQRGTAVIAAMLVAAAAALAAANIIEQQSLLVDTLARERDRAQAQWILRGGLDWARVILQQDGQRPTTRLDDAWAQPIVRLQIGGDGGDFGGSRQALFSGRIEDEQGKYNLRQLVAGREIVPEAVAALARLFGLLDIPAELADAMAQRVLDGERDGPAPGLRRLADLASMDDMQAETLDALRAYLTVLPRAARVNVNTAPAEVLSAVLPALSLTQARELVEQRARGLWFTNAADFFNRMGAAPNAYPDRFAVRSDWFLVTGEVALADAVVSTQALLRRGNASQAPQIRWMTP